MSLITTDRKLLESIAAVVDVAEGYVPKRAPDYVTERHADITTHPDGKSYAYPDDDVVRKHTAIVIDELVKVGASKTAVTTAWTNIQDAKSITKQVSVGTTTLTWMEKDASWTPKEPGEISPVEPESK